MKRFQILILFIILIKPAISRADFNHIQFDRIKGFHKYEKDIDFLKANEDYFRHFSPEWNYPVSKSEIIIKLKNTYNLFSSLEDPGDNPELQLLLGDISAYLYNLSEDVYFQKSIEHFNTVIEKFPDDYRGYWFYGTDLSNTNLIVKAMELFQKAESMAPVKKPSQFWKDYVFASRLANMPSHTNYALEQYKKESIKWNKEDEIYYNSLKFKFLETNPDTVYSRNLVWNPEFNESRKVISFSSRSLGIKIMYDSTWAYKLAGFQNRGSAILMNPPRLDPKGKNILYSIVLSAKSATPNENLNDYLKVYMPKDPIQKKILFNSHFKNVIGYELLNKDRYPQIGGSHLIVIGFEREDPEFPGLNLENSNSLPINGSSQPQLFKFDQVKTRIKGKIFYVFLLDTCEDIFQESFSNFKSFVENKILVD